MIKKKRMFYNAGIKVLYDKGPWTMSGGEPSSIKWISLCIL